MLKQSEFIEKFKPVHLDESGLILPYAHIEEKGMTYKDAVKLVKKMGIADKDINKHIWATVETKLRYDFLWAQSILVVAKPYPNSNQADHYVTQVSRKGNIEMGANLFSYAALAYVNVPLVEMPEPNTFGITGSSNQLAMIIDDGHGIEGPPFREVLFFELLEQEIVLTYSINGQRIGDIAIDKRTDDSISEERLMQLMPFDGRDKDTKTASVKITSDNEINNANMEWFGFSYLIDKQGIDPYQLSHVIIEAFGCEISLYFKKEDVLVNGISMKAQCPTSQPTLTQSRSGF